MKKKIIACVLIFIFIGAAVFADTILQCRDPADGKITITFLGSALFATYSGISAQTFEVIVLLKDGTTQYLTFSFLKATSIQTRRQDQLARGPIEQIYHCDFKTPYN